MTAGASTGRSALTASSVIRTGPGPSPLQAIRVMKCRRVRLVQFDPTFERWADDLDQADAEALLAAFGSCETAGLRSVARSSTR